MKLASFIGFVGMVPAALNPAPGSEAQTMTMLVCGGEGIARTATVPLERQSPAQERGKPCCEKGCHGRRSRRRVVYDL